MIHISVRLSERSKVTQDPVADLGVGVDPARAPPMDQHFFNFIGFSEKITKILGRDP